MIAFGMTNAEAARRLHLSVHAIKFHLAAIYRRLGVNNRTEAAVTYLRSMNGSARADPTERLTWTSSSMPASSGGSGCSSSSG